MGETNKQLSKRLITANDAFVWLLGYNDFPVKREGDTAYYWRTHLRNKLANNGFILSLPKPKKDDK